MVFFLGLPPVSVNDVPGAFGEDVFPLYAQYSPSGIDTFVPKTLIIYLVDVVFVNVWYGYGPIVRGVFDRHGRRTLFIIGGDYPLIEVVRAGCELWSVCGIHVFAHPRIATRNPSVARSGEVGRGEACWCTGPCPDRWA